MSVRLSTSLPRACSGLIYPGVPTICPATDSIPVTVANRERSWFPSGLQIAFANPKSNTFTRSCGVTFTLGSFEIAVNDSSFVRCFQSSCHLPGTLQRGVNWQRTAQHFALNQLHDQEVGLVGFFQSVDRGDIGVDQKSEGARFPTEARQPIRVARELLGQCLDGDIAAELTIVRPIYLAHAAGT